MTGVQTCALPIYFFQEFPEAVFDGVAWNRYDTLTASGQGHSTDNARESGQKVHNYRSDHWIALKCFSRVSGGYFRWIAWNRYDTPTASGRGHSNDNDREPGQKVHNYTSDHWIALKCFSRVSGGCFDRGAWNRYDTPTASGRGHSIDSARESGQKVHNYRSDRWIALNFFSRISEGFFGWSYDESVRHSDGVRSGHSTDTTSEPGQKVHNFRSDRWIKLKCFSRVSEGCFQWSCVESVRHATDDRSGPFHR